MNIHEKINYVELPSKNLQATKTFFSTVFGWSFTDYGPEYTAFSNEGLDGGFYLSNLSSMSGGALLVFYSANITDTQHKISQAGGVIVKPVFAFPGGRRFHFTEPSGNEFAVWSEAEAL